MRTNDFKLISILMIFILGLVACGEQPAPAIVGTWQCNDGKEITYFSDNTYVSHPRSSNQNTDLLEAGRYKLGGQKLFTTTMAIRFLIAPNNQYPRGWVEYLNNPPKTSSSKYPTFENRLLSWTDRQMVTKTIRVFNFANQDSIEANPDAPQDTCVKADQLYKQFESIKAEIPLRLL